MEVDKFCASYFQVAFAYDNRDVLEEFLKNVRDALHNRQAREVSYIGDLGDFCERVLEMNFPAPLVEFQSRNHTDEAINRYLQGALELPYWEIGLDAFMNWKNIDNKSDIPVYMLCMLAHTRTFCRKGLQRLRDEAAGSKDQQSVEEIARGIEDRLRLLDSTLRGKIKDIDVLDDGIRRKSSQLNASKATQEVRDPYILAIIRRVPRMPVTDQVTGNDHHVGLGLRLLDSRHRPRLQRVCHILGRGAKRKH